jgi:hypothetical protein
MMVKTTSFDNPKRKTEFVLFLHFDCFLVLLASVGPVPLILPACDP